MQLFIRGIAICSALWLIGFLVFVLWQQTTYVQDPLRKTDAILVLTGGTNRITTGLHLMAADNAGHMMISGVAKGTTLSRLLIDNNLPQEIQTRLQAQCCIILGEQATNTIQNAMEAAPWIEKHQFKSIRLVTSIYHIPRSLLHLKQHVKGDIDWVLHPVRPSSPLTDINHWKIVLQEYTKLTIALPLSLYAVP